MKENLWFLYFILIIISYAGKTTYLLHIITSLKKHFEYYNNI